MRFAKASCFEPTPVPDILPDILETPVKVTLAATPLKVGKLIKRLDACLADDEWAGFDTEAVGPLLRGRDFINITYASLLGLSLAFEDDTTYYMPFRHKGRNATFMDLHEVGTRLQRLAKTNRLWAHNAKFDHQVMIKAGYPLEGLLDSMIAAWLVTGKNKGIGLKELAASLLSRKSPEFDPAIVHKTGDEVKEYAGHDALNTLQLGQHYATKLGDWEWFLEECKFAHGLAEMKLQGIGLDRKGLQAIRDAGKAELRKTLGMWSEIAPDISITSSKQLQVLFEEGIWESIGNTATGAYQTGSQAMKHNVSVGRGDGKLLAELRLAHQETSKIVNTYTDGLIEEALQWQDKKIHPDLYQFGTVTGRLASAHPNIQNQPAHGQWAKRVRECYVPDQGMEFTSADYSQVELRYFADYCGGALLDAFVNGEDLHQRTAEAMGITRDKGKMVNFGFLLYGGGPDKLAGELGCSREEAEEKIEELHKTYPEVEKWRAHVIKIVSSRGPVPWCKTLAGRIRHIPELNQLTMRTHYPVEYQQLVNKVRAKYKVRGRALTSIALEWSIRSRGERLVVNYLVQGGARDLLVLGMNKYRSLAPEGFSIATTVHDEVLTQHPIGRGEDARSILKECLEGAGPTLGLKVPIVAEPKTGSNWAEVK